MQYSTLIILTLLKLWALFMRVVSRQEPGMRLSLRFVGRTETQTVGQTLALRPPQAPSCGRKCLALGRAGSQATLISSWLPFPFVDGLPQLLLQQSGPPWAGCPLGLICLEKGEPFLPTPGLHMFPTLGPREGPLLSPFPRAASCSFCLQMPSPSHPTSTTADSVQESASDTSEQQ